MRNADSQNELRLKIKLQSKREDALANEQQASLQVMDEDTAQTF